MRSIEQTTIRNRILSSVCLAILSSATAYAEPQAGEATAPAPSLRLSSPALALKFSLTDRVDRMLQFLEDDVRARWNTWKVHGYEVGATGNKNADSGTMCMIARNADDRTMQRRMPALRNFKLAQQQTAAPVVNRPEGSMKLAIPAWGMQVIALYLGGHGG